MRFELSGYAIDWEAVQGTAGVVSGAAVVLAGRRGEKVVLIFGPGEERLEVDADPPRIHLDTSRYADFLASLRHARAENADIEVRVAPGPPAHVTLAAVF